MQLLIAGVPFVVEPDDMLTPADRTALARLDAAGSVETCRCATPFRLEITADDSWRSAERAAREDGATAIVDTVDGRVRVIHRRLFAEIDVPARHARVVRSPTGGLGVDIVLRTALCVALPYTDGLPLHAAAVVMRGGGVVFFGPSGAGKSTFAAACPWPVLTDELVAVFGDPPRVQAAGFWGTAESDGAVVGSYALGALVELAKDERFELSRLGPRAALRRLVSVVLIPPDPELWRRGLAILARLVDALPVYRMSWTPREPHWDELRAKLAAGAHAT